MILNPREKGDKRDLKPRKTQIDSHPKCFNSLNFSTRTPHSNIRIECCWLFSGQLLVTAMDVSNQEPPQIWALPIRDVRNRNCPLQTHRNCLKIAVDYSIQFLSIFGPLITLIAVFLSISEFDAVRLRLPRRRNTRPSAV
jgi:hypothetical protein